MCIYFLYCTSCIDCPPCLFAYTNDRFTGICCLVTPACMAILLARAPCQIYFSPHRLPARPHCLPAEIALSPTHFDFFFPASLVYSSSGFLCSHPGDYYRPVLNPPLSPIPILLSTHPLPPHPNQQVFNVLPCRRRTLPP